MFALKIGTFGRKEMPAIEDEDGRSGCIDLDWWIAFTQRSERLEEVSHPDDRPTALFHCAGGSKFEVRYQFGKIVPQDWECTDSAPMLELLAHMNEGKKEPIQPLQPTPLKRRG